MVFKVIIVFFFKRGLSFVFRRGLSFVIVVGVAFFAYGSSSARITSSWFPSLWEGSFWEKLWSGSADGENNGALTDSHAHSKQSSAQEENILKEYPSASTPFKVERLAQELGVVWGMVFISNHEILFTEREGGLKKLNLQTGAIIKIAGAPKVYAVGQGGLLDVALHPRFSQNQRVYFSYSKEFSGTQTTAVATARLQENKLIGLKDIFIAHPAVDSRHHFGSRMVFDRQGFLYVSVGDRHERHLAQKLDNHLGKILRLTDEGKAPADNPFTTTPGAKPEIWSFGHRNPQGLFIHPKTGHLWEQEHGPRGGDEINLIQKGKNYGWPVITHGREYWGPKIGEGTAKEGMEQPVKHYTPSIAPCGFLIYSGKKFTKWKHDMFSGALALQHLNRLKVVNQKVLQEERLLQDLRFRVRSVIEGPQGFIYISVDGGNILRLKPL